jgi:serine/threonine protein phosphatase PrpC
MLEGEALEKTQEQQEGPAPETDLHKSWEFVIQGQHDSSPQQDFAPKIVSCFPDDAAEQALKRGVVCVCSRGRRLDASMPNQDDFVAARHRLTQGGHIALYGVFDGHGPAGHHCAAFARGALPESLFGQRSLLLRPEETLQEAFRRTQESLLQQPFDTAHSGTTAVLAMVLNLPTPGPQGSGGETWLFVAHVGDSRAILASQRASDSDAFTVTALSGDHRPDCADEAERIQQHGGEIRTLHENSGAARVFGRGQDGPALALTRSLGASAAVKCGVLSEPEVSAYRLRPGVDVLLILGTDGLFEFRSNTNAAGHVLKEGVTTEALQKLCASSRCLWSRSSYNETVDDITAIAVTLPSKLASGA